MVEEIRRLLYYLKKNTGKFEFTETEILNVLSIRTRYLTPDQVKEFLRIAIEEKCLKEADGVYSITCSINGIELSIDYKPDFESIVNERNGEDETEKIVSYIIERTKLTKRDIIAEINRIREQNPFLSAKVAALMIARLNDLDIGEFTKVV